jgi:hypothetical protein
MWRDAEHTLDQHELPAVMHLMLLDTQDHVEPADLPDRTAGLRDQKRTHEISVKRPYRRVAATGSMLMRGKSERRSGADSGQVDGTAPAPGPHHRGDRRSGVPAGPELRAVTDAERPGGVDPPSTGLKIAVFAPIPKARPV